VGAHAGDAPLRVGRPSLAAAAPPAGRLVGRAARYRGWPGRPDAKPNGVHVGPRRPRAVLLRQRDLRHHPHPRPWRSISNACCRGGGAGIRQENVGGRGAQKLVQGRGRDPEMKARRVRPTDSRSRVGSSTKTSAQSRINDGKHGAWGTGMRRPRTASRGPTASDSGWNVGGKPPDRWPLRGSETALIVVHWTSLRLECGR